MASRRRHEHPSIIKGPAWKASGQMLGSSPAQSGELQGKCQGALPSTRALLLTFYFLTHRKGRLVVTPPHTILSRGPKIFLSQWPSQTHGAHMAGTWPAQFPAQLWCPRVVLEEFGVRLEEAFFDPDFAELLVKNNRICEIPVIWTSLFWPRLC